VLSEDFLDAYAANPAALAEDVTAAGAVVDG